jgi:predicted acyl esterase
MPPHRFIVSVATATAITLAARGVIGAQITSDKAPPYQIEAHYKKYEYVIPMRDGVKLFTSVFVPRDTTSSYPILMTRTPYGVAPYGETGYPRALGPSEDSWARDTFSFARTCAVVSSLVGRSYK